MDPTMISVFAVGATLLAVGASLAGIILAGQRSMRTEIGAVETRLGKRIDAVQGEVKEVESRLGKRIDRLEDRVTGLDSRLSHLEGALSAVLGPLRRTPVTEPTPDESPV